MSDFPSRRRVFPESGVLGQEDDGKTVNMFLFPEIGIILSFELCRIRSGLNPMIRSPFTGSVCQAVDNSMAGRC